MQHRGEIFRRESVIYERLPSGRLDRTDVYGADIPQHPEWLVCDCCLEHVDRLWLFEQYGFCFWAGRQRRILEAGFWAFCVQCKALWDAQALPVLVARVVTLNPELLERDVAPLYSILPDVLHGECVAWEAPQCPPRVAGR